MIRALIDTNVLLDHLLPRAEFVDVATEIWNANQEGRFEGYICAVSPTDIFYIGRKLMGGTDAARQAITALLASWRVCPVTASELQAALSLPMDDYEDAVQVASAKAQGIDRLVTRNPQDYRDSGLAVLSPEDFLRSITDPQAQ